VSVSSDRTQAIFAKIEVLTTHEFRLNPMTKIASRQGRIFPEIQWTIDRVAAREAEREAFYQRCYLIFDRVRSELIATHYNWYVAIEPDSGDRFIDRDLEVASLQCRAKHPSKLHYTFRINESGTCGTI
jgi:hypothetical protein